MKRVTHILLDTQVSGVFGTFVFAHFDPCRQTALRFTVGADGRYEHKLVDLNPVGVFLVFDTVSADTAALPVVSVKLLEAVPLLERRIERKRLGRRRKLGLFRFGGCFGNRFENTRGERRPRYGISGPFQKATSTLYESRLFVIHFCHSRPP